MKILYFANFSDKAYGFTRDIESSLKKLGHKVESINDRNFKNEELLEKSKKADLFLFHHGGVWTDSEMNFVMSLERLKQILLIVKAKKVCWFPDKVWFLNDRMMEEIIPLTNKTFLNDATWGKRHKYTNVIPLHTAVGKVEQGEFKKEFNADVSFYGSIHGFIKPYINLLKENFGNGFRVYEGLYGKQLADMIASSKMVFVPVQPNDEFYWCNRIYQILGHGGVAIYPKLHGLSEEGFIAGQHYIGYKMAADLVETIKEYLDNPKRLERIAQRGKEFVQRFTYENRVKELLSKI